MKANAEHPTQTSETVVRPERKAAWRFWVVTSVFVAAEMAGLLCGARIISFGAVGGPWAGALAAGWSIECWLLQFSGKWIVSDDRPLGCHSRAMSFGTVYILPPVLASVAGVLGWWYTVFSLLLFSALAVRIALLWSRRQFAD